MTRFRSIGTLASDVMRELETGRQAADKGDSSLPMSSGMDGKERAARHTGRTAGAPVPSRDAPPLSSSGMGKDEPSGEARPKVTGRYVKPGEARGTSFTNGRHMPVAVPVGTGMRSVKPPTGFPAPTLRRPLLIVIEGGRHPTSP